MKSQSGGCVTGTEAAKTIRGFPLGRFGAVKGDRVRRSFWLLLKRSMAH